MNLSFGLEVIATEANLFTWGMLKATWSELLLPYTEIVLGPTPQLIDMDTKEPLNDTDMIADHLVDGTRLFKFSLAVSTGMVMFAELNRLSAYENGEKEVIHSEGKNKDLDLLDSIARQWETAGMFYSLESYIPGRSSYEVKLFVTLAAAIARLCSGYVLWTDGGFDLAEGLYTPDEILQLRPNDSLWLGFDDQT